jgi:hypothetical protein
MHQLGRLMTKNSRAEFDSTQVLAKRFLVEVLDYLESRPIVAGIHNGDSERDFTVHFAAVTY